MGRPGFRVTASGTVVALPIFTGKEVIEAMFVPERAELESQIVKLRQTLSALHNQHDRFGLTLKLERLEEELAALYPPPPAPFKRPARPAAAGDGEPRAYSRS